MILWLIVYLFIYLFCLNIVLSIYKIIELYNLNLGFKLLSITIDHYRQKKSLSLSLSVKISLSLIPGVKRQKIPTVEEKIPTEINCRCTIKLLLVDKYVISLNKAAGCPSVFNTWVKGAKSTTGSSCLLYILKSQYVLDNEVDWLEYIILMHYDLCCF